MNSMIEKKKLYTVLPLTLAIEKWNTEFQGNSKQLKKKRIKKLLNDLVWS